MEGYAVDQEFLEARRQEMETSREVMRADLLAKGVPASLTGAVVQKVVDHHSANYRYLEMREHLREREYSVKAAAAASGVQLPHSTAVYQFDQSHIWAKKVCMEECTDHIVRWMHSAHLVPSMRLSLHQVMIDADFGRREWLRQIEYLKMQESKIVAWEEAVRKVKP